MGEKINETPSPTSLTTAGFVDDPCFSESLLCKSLGKATREILNRSIDICDVLFQKVVLHIENLPMCYAYDDIDRIFSKHGKILSISFDHVSGHNLWDCYILFENHEAATEAFNFCKGRKLSSVDISAEVLFADDFLSTGRVYNPQQMNDILDLEPELRTPDTPRWFIINQREGKTNLIKTSRYLRKRIGPFQDKSLKRYGRRSLLFYAEDEIISKMIINMKLGEDDPVEDIKPHRSFNNFKGVFHSRDIYEFDSQEILDMCPSNIFKIEKIQNSKTGIIIYAVNDRPVSEIVICSIRCKVSPYKDRPMQCKHCLEFGHSKECKNDVCCNNCSQHHLSGNCTREKYCKHCDSNEHGPNDRKCPRYLFEGEILALANTEHIGFSEARYRLKGINRSLGSTYASIVKKMKNQRPIKQSVTTSAPRSQMKSNKPVVSTPRQQSNVQTAISKPSGRPPVSEAAVEVIPSTVLKAAETHSVALSPSESLPDLERTGDSVPGSNVQASSIMKPVKDKILEIGNGWQQASSKKRGRSPKGSQSKDLPTSNHFDALADDDVPASKAKKPIHEGVKEQKKVVLNKKTPQVQLVDKKTKTLDSRIPKTDNTKPASFRLKNK